MEVKNKMKKPYMKITYFQNEIFEHNNNEIIVEKKEVIDKIHELLESYEEGRIKQK